MASLPAVRIRPPRPPLDGLRVLVVGRGRVGRGLAGALSARGAAVATAPGSPAAGSPGTSIRHGLSPEVGLVLLTVPDDAIADTAERLASRVHAGLVVAHTSGLHGLGVLDAVRRGGAHGLAFHPAMTFEGSKYDAARLHGARIGVTADPGAEELAGRLGMALGATLVDIAEAQRALYHAGLTHAASHLVTLVSEAQSLLARAGVGDPSAVLAPLVRAALERALEQGAAATTGPVVRGDAGTVSAHLQALAAAAPGLLPSYRVLAADTLRLAAADGRLGEAAAARVDAVLAEATHAASGLPA